MIIDQCKDKVPAELASHEAELIVPNKCYVPIKQEQHGWGGGGWVEGEREEAGAARLWAGTGGKRKWERHLS